MSQRACAAALAALLLGSLATGVVASRSQDYRLQDFDCLRGAAVLVVEGRDPYDPPTWAVATGLPAAAASEARRGSCLGRRFAYPLWTAVAMAPFALLPYPATAALWVALNAAAALGGTLLALRAVGGPWRAAPLAVALVAASQPFALTVWSGQIDGIEAGLIGLSAWALARGWDARAGTALALALLKPQLLAVTVPAVAAWALARRRPRTLGGLAAAGGVLLAASLAVRPDWIGPWLDETTGARLAIARLLPTAWGFAADLTGSAAWGALLAGALAATVARMARGRAGARTVPADAATGAAELVALAAALSLVVTPHAWSYDHLALAPAWAMLVARASVATGASRAALLATTVVVASALPWSLYAVALARATETWSVLVPVCASLALAASLAGADRRGGGVSARSRPA